MSLKIIITESQNQYIILENAKKNFESNLERSKDFATQVFEEVKKQTNIDFKFLMTWGAGIGGFMEPVADFVKGEFPEISFSSLCLILISVVCTLFLENLTVTSKLINKIREEKLSKIFERSLEKSLELKTAFVEFLLSIGVSFSKLINMLSYTFIIPMLGVFIELGQNAQISSSTADEMALRLTSFGVITISAKTLSVLFKKILKRFSS